MATASTSGSGEEFMVVTAGVADTCRALHLGELLAALIRDADQIHDPRGLNGLEVEHRSDSSAANYSEAEHTRE